MTDKNPEIRIEDDSGDKDFFTTLPNFVLNHSNANDRGLYSEMKRFAGERGKCFATQKTMMRRLEIGEKAYQKSLDYLLKRGWITFVGLTKGKTRPIKTYKVNNIWEENTAYYKGLKKISSESTLSFSRDKSQKQTKISSESRIEEEPYTKKKIQGDETSSSQKFDKWLEENCKEVEHYFGEEEGTGTGYLHKARKTPFTLEGIKQIYNRTLMASVGPKMPSRDEFHYDYDKWLIKLRNSPQRTDNIVALIWKEKRYRFDNSEQWKSQFDMDKKYASRLKGYTGKQITEAIYICQDESRRVGYEWGASTVVKKIANLTT